MIQKEEFLQDVPKICVPIVEKTLDGIVKQACTLNDTKCDIVEWRVDYYEGVMQLEDVIDALSVLKDVLSKPILFTFRTKQEGGELSLTKEAYRELLCRIIETGMIELVDVEAYYDEKICEQIIKCAHNHNVLVIASNHNFVETPTEEEIIKRLFYMKEIGGDIAKIAVMPKNKSDVLQLLSASVKVKETDPMLPFITMSMSKIGMISRYACEFDGSVMTFASVGKGSAPGQIPLEKLEQIISLVSNK